MPRYDVLTPSPLRLRTRCDPTGAILVDTDSAGSSFGPGNHIARDSSDDRLGGEQRKRVARVP